MVCKAGRSYQENSRYQGTTSSLPMVDRNVMRSVLPLLTCLLLVLLPTGGSVSAQGDLRQEFLRLINADRQRAGARPLSLSPALNRAAQDHAAEVARRGSLKLRAGSTEE